MGTSIALTVSLFSCRSDSGYKETQGEVAAPAPANLVDTHPDWIMQGNIYEVNIRQYTQEGSFKAFEKSLPRLKEMGVQTLWFMPINPISKVDRKGVMGSYYAVADYTKVNPEFGTMDDWKELVRHSHAMGFKVILDWVPNHSSSAHPWFVEARAGRETQVMRPDAEQRTAGGEQSCTPLGQGVRDGDQISAQLLGAAVRGARHRGGLGALGGLRELTALFVEDGHDVRDLIEPAYAAARAILGPRS